MEKIDKFAPELDLDASEVGLLVALMAHPGFHTWVKVGRNQVQKYFSRLLNTDSTTPEQVLENHRLAKLSAQMFQGFVESLEHLRTVYVSSSGIQKPVDVTEGILDYGEQVLDGVDNLSEEADSIL